MPIKIIDPINEESLVRKCISRKNQETYLKKMIQGKIILYANYKKDEFFGVTGIEFNREVNYLDFKREKRICLCDYICAGHTFTKFRKKGFAKSILNYILDNHLTEDNLIGISLTGNKINNGISKEILQKTFIKNLKKGFKVQGHRPDHLGPFMVLNKENYRRIE